MAKQKTRYYVSVIDGKRYDLLAGPYKTHEQALAQVDLARRLTIDTWSEAAFYSFGTVGVKDGYNKPGLLNQMSLM